MSGEKNLTNEPTPQQFLDILGKPYLIRNYPSHEVTDIISGKKREKTIDFKYIWIFGNYQFEIEFYDGLNEPIEFKRSNYLVDKDGITYQYQRISFQELLESSELTAEQQNLFLFNLWMFL